MLDEGYLAQRKSEVGQLAQRVEAAREDLQRAEQRRIAMQDNYVDKNAQWKIDHRRVMEQLRLAEVADITSDLVSAAQADVELTEGRVTLLRLRIGVLKIQEEVERKEIYLKGLVNTQRAVSQMEDELSNAKQELAFEELQWAEDWDDWTALTVDLSAKVSGKRKDTSFEEDRYANYSKTPRTLAKITEGSPNVPGSRTRINALADRPGVKHCVVRGRFKTLGKLDRFQDRSIFENNFNCRLLTGVFVFITLSLIGKMRFLGSY